MAVGGVVELNETGSARIDYRRLTQAGWDGLSWTLAVPLATALRYDFSVASASLLSALTLGVALGLVQIALGYLIQAFRGRAIIGSFDEIFAVVASSAFVTIVGTIYIALINLPPLPRSVPLIAGAIVIGLLLGGRFIVRALRQRSLLAKDGQRVLIYGAGDSGEQIVRQMLTSADGGFTPVAFLDDNPRKNRLRIQGVSVVGTIGDLERVVQATGAQTLIVAIAGVSSAQLLELDRRTTALGIALRVIPTTSEIIGGAVKLGDISHVTEEDLLGRRPVQTDESAIADLLRGKRILITGAGGSIGSEIARQVHRYQPSFVGILDRDESAIQNVQLSIDGQGLLSSDDLILADIRDANRMREVFDAVRPEIVFHAAALKHLSLLERYPEEAHKTNILGTINVLEASHASGVETFINISTDKAANPVNVLGNSKLLTEQLTAGMTQDPFSGAPKSRYLSVRFGNVLGSRGSVLNTFRHQIARGGPVTVTDPHVTRYFMTIPEAVHLVLQASVIGDHGETLILDMGEPVQIAKVAEQMIAKSGRQIEIVFTGLRPGEKMEEVLTDACDEVRAGPHPLISHIRVRPMSIESLNV